MNILAKIVTVLTKSSDSNVFSITGNKKASLIHCIIRGAFVYCLIIFISFSTDCSTFSLSTFRVMSAYFL